MLIVPLSSPCVDVTLPTDVISVISVVLCKSRLICGTDNFVCPNNGSESQLPPSIQFLNSGPNFRINAFKKKK